MKTIIQSVVAAGLLAVLFWSCSQVPLTGRRQLQLLPESQLMAMGLQNYQQFLNEHKVVHGTPDAQMVKRVGERIAAATESYLKRKGASDRVKGYKWEFNLAEDKSVNAWCMPGGKVVFYTGILPFTKDEAGLAVVMGHEIAHAIARHGNERISQALSLQMGGLALDVALSQKPEETRNIFLAAYGVGSTVGVMLPFSRKHESEADEMGLMFMAMAGYDPERAISFWQGMKAGGAQPPEFLSTHPSHDTRIKQIREDFLPGAKMLYRKYGGG